jgi:hypothetical protein
MESINIIYCYSQLFKKPDIAVYLIKIIMNVVIELRIKDIIKRCNTTLSLPCQ